jgi:hypothetical protein
MFHRVPNERALSGRGEVDKVVRVPVWGIFVVPELHPRSGCVGYPAPPGFSTESFIAFCRVPEAEATHILW